MSFLITNDLEHFSWVTKISNFLYIFLRLFCFQFGITSKKGNKFFFSSKTHHGKSISPYAKFPLESLAKKKKASFGACFISTLALISCCLSHSLWKWVHMPIFSIIFRIPIIIICYVMTFLINMIKIF